jgi:ribulose-phosphate 3-epimerase
MARIAPSILSADFACLGDAIDRVEPAADLLHVDVMDGHFVPNLTIGPPVVAAIRRHTDLYLDCHLMMTNPGQYLEAFRRAGADGCSVHVEVDDTQNLIDRMRALGLDVGLAVNPETPFDAFSGWLDQLDLVLLMTVHPGFGGQRFMHEVVPKIRRTREEIDSRGLAVAIEVDGGIDVDTAADAAEAGASVFVAGSAVFGEPDPAAAASAIRAAADRASRQGPAEPADPDTAGGPRASAGRTEGFS